MSNAPPAAPVPIPTKPTAGSKLSTWDIPSELHFGEAHQLSGSPGSSTGYISQLASSIPSTLPDLGIGDYIPEFVKNYAAGGAEQRADLKSRERVTWVHFETRPAPAATSSTPATRMYLILGYVDGFQVWDVTDQSKLVEVVSKRDGVPCRVVKFLADPAVVVSQSKPLPLDTARPLLAVTSAVDREAFPRSIVKMYSMSFKQYAHELRFKSPVFGVESNSEIVAVSLYDVIYAFSAQTLDHCFGVSCYASPLTGGVSALGTRWLAYPGLLQADDQRLNVLQGAEAETWSMSAMVKDLATGIYYLGGLGKKQINNYLNKQGGAPVPLHHQDVHRPSTPTPSNLGSGAMGTISANGGGDVTSDHVSNGTAGATPGSQLSSSSSAGSVIVRDIRTRAVVANFKAHKNAIAIMAFNPSGSLLVTASTDGQTIHVYAITPKTPFNGTSASSSQGRPTSSSAADQQPGSGKEHPNATHAQSPISHRLLYKLERGITHATIAHLSFSADLRWIGVTSQRGTTHLFPVSCAGGEATIFSHPTVPMVGGGKRPYLRHGSGRSSSGNWGAAVAGVASSAMGKLKKNFLSGGEAVPADDRQSDLAPLHADSCDVTFDVSQSTTSGAPGEGTLLDFEAERKEAKRHVKLSQQQAAELAAAQQESEKGAFVVPLSTPPVFLRVKANDTPVSVSALGRIRQSVVPSASVSPSMSNPSSLGSNSSYSVANGGGGRAVAGSRDSHSSLLVAANHAVAGDMMAEVEWINQMPPSVSTAFRGNSVYAVSSGGMLSQHVLTPRSHHELDPADGPNKLAVDLDISFVKSWDVCRRAHWPEVAASPQSNVPRPSPQVPTNGAASTASTEPPSSRADWLSNVEIVTHAKPLVQLWSKPQFRYCTYDADSHPSRNPLSTGSIVGTPLEIRGSGPAPTLPADLNSAPPSAQQPILHDLKIAMETDVEFCITDLAGTPTRHAQHLPPGDVVDIMNSPDLSLEAFAADSIESIPPMSLNDGAGSAKLVIASSPLVPKKTPEDSSLHALGGSLTGMSTTTSTKRKKKNKKANGLAGSGKKKVS